MSICTGEDRADVARGVVIPPEDAPRPPWDPDTWPRYTLQVGAFKDERNALQLLHRLPPHRPSEIVVGEEGEHAIYRVRWGHFSRSAEASRARSELWKGADDAFVVPAGSRRFLEPLDIAVRVARRASELGFQAPSCVRVVRTADDEFIEEVGYSRPLTIELRWTDRAELHTLDLSDECDGLNVYSDLPWMTPMGMRVRDLPSGSPVLECLRHGATEAACREGD